MAISVLAISAILSTRWGEGKRLISIALCYIPGIIATALLFSVEVAPGTKGVHLFAMFLIPIVASAGGLMYTILASNVAGYTKKVLAGAMFFSSYCVSNIVSPQVFLSREAPHYATGIAVCLSMYGANIVIFGMLYFLYRRENAIRDREDPGRVFDEDMDLTNAFSDLSDRQNKTMRYKL